MDGDLHKPGSGIKNINMRQNAFFIKIGVLRCKTYFCTIRVFMPIITVPYLAVFSSRNHFIIYPKVHFGEFCRNFQTLLIGRKRPNERLVKSFERCLVEFHGSLFMSSERFLSY